MELSVRRPYTIVIALIVLLFIFLGISLLAWFFKTEITQKVFVTVLRDNDPYDRHCYLMIIHTGKRFNAGTTANMVVQLNGSESDSYIYISSDHRTNGFKSWSTNHFLIFTEKPLGPLIGLTYMLQTQDNTATWFLSDIEVHDLDTMKSWELLFNSWLVTDSERQTEKHHKEVKPEDSSEKPSDKDMPFMSRLASQFREDYVWFGLSKRIHRYFVPNWTLLSLILLFIILALFINLLIRGVPRRDPVEHIGEYGFQILWRDVKYGFINAAILVMFLPMFYVMRYLFSDEDLVIYIDLDENWTKRDGKTEDLSPAVSSAGDVVAIIQSSTLTYIIKRTEPKFELKEQGNADKSPSEAPGDKDTGSSEDPKDSTMSEPEDHKEIRKSSTKFNYIIITLAIVWCLIIIFIIVNICWGLRMSHTKVCMWIFSTIVSLLVCVFVFHPIVIIFSTIWFPWKGQDIAKRLSNDLEEIIKARNDRIMLSGTLDEYVSYLKRLRATGAYQDLKNLL